MSLSRRRFLESASAAVLGTAANLSGSARSAASQEGEVLYNGVRLPRQWPPRLEELSGEPMAVPDYRPAVIPIDVGRQLFVDDFLIEQTTLVRKFHTATYHPNCPVLRPDGYWEKACEQRPAAMPFPDGVWYDPAYGRFRMWYRAAFMPSTTCYAESQDGVKWEKPALDLPIQFDPSYGGEAARLGSNIVQPTDRDAATVWLDLNEADPKRRYKFARIPWINEDSDERLWLNLYFSPDGIHWSNLVARSGPCGDWSAFFYNPFRKVWVFNLRSYFKGVGRCRRYWESADFVAGANWTTGQPTLWVGADRLDPPEPPVPNGMCQLYSLVAVAYESVMLGCFSIMRGQNLAYFAGEVRKGNDIVLGYSRDGFYWNRPDRRPFIAKSSKPGDWNYDYLHSASACCLIVGDKLYFYVCGRSDLHIHPDAFHSTGLAILRRDGFASMQADEAGGTLTTRPVRFGGNYLFVNADAASGELRAEVLDEQGRVVEPFTQARCGPVGGDSTLTQVKWKGVSSLAGLAGKPVRFRFLLRKASLYAFWVSREASGASQGYVAAGGPGFTGATDTVGADAYKATK
jgi:hypothetical protein